jgi:glutathione S-transferase
MKLINARPSPFGRKVAVALHEKGVPFETVWDQPWGAETCVGHYNPLSQLPVLIADDGEICFESNYILEWIERRFPRPPLLPSDDDGILDVKRVMVVAEGVLNATGHVAFELMREHPSAAWLERQRNKMRQGVDWIGERVGARSFAVGDFTQADIAVAVTLTSLEFIRASYGFELEEEPWRERLPFLGLYVDRLEQRPSFIATRPAPMEGTVQELAG